MRPNGLTCTVAPITIEPISGGRHLSLFHDSRRIYSSISSDGGLTWSEQRLAAEDPDAFLCEPVVIRSPDGKQLAAVMRENSRWFNAYVHCSSEETQGRVLEQTGGTSRQLEPGTGIMHATMPTGES